MSGEPPASAPLDRYHFPVVNLGNVENPFELAGVTFRPRGWVATLYAEPAVNEADNHKWLRERFAREAAELAFATADAMAPSVEDARNRVSDAVDLLRLYQRRSLPFANLEHQTFGLPGAVERTLDHHWRTRDDGTIGEGWNVSGVLGGWSFDAKAIAAMLEDVVIRRLGAALLKPVDDVTDVERRAVTCLRIASVQTVSVRAALRIVLLAVALEALLGDGKQRDRTHRICLRAAYLTCRDGDIPHGADRRCPYFATRSRDELRVCMKREQAAGRHGFCSQYWWYAEIFETRNTILHEASLKSEHRQAGVYAGRVDDVLGELLSNRGAQPPATLSELDDAMRTAVGEWPGVADAR